MLQTETAQQHQQHYFERGLREVIEAGDGAVTLTVIGPGSVRALVTAVMADDVLAKAVLQAADRLLRRIDRCSRARALPCLLCGDGLLWRGEAPHAVGVLTPYGIEARVAVGLAFCSECAAGCSETALGHAVVAKFRAEWMPGLRSFQPVAQVGHA